MDKDKIEMMLKLMDYDYLTDSQLDLIISFSDQYQQRGRLSDRQLEILTDIFQRAAEV